MKPEFAALVPLGVPKGSEDTYDQGAVSKCFVSKHHTNMTTAGGFSDRDDLKLPRSVPPHAWTSAKTKAEGKTEKAAGKVQNAVGGLNDAARGK
jgi:hypothetical protein